MARREGLGETDFILGQSIQRGRLDAAVTVAMHVVGTQRIDGYEKNIWGCEKNTWRLCLRLGQPIGVPDCGQTAEQYQTTGLHGD